ncbi:hypothetical protein BT69DRAFT_1330954 [Atractiella rhizophila]|nr:hypothetical protein BT69DRAFT_1330954 [Atractiella rhizophila]
MVLLNNPTISLELPYGGAFLHPSSDTELPSAETVYSAKCILTLPKPRQQSLMTLSCFADMKDRALPEIVITLRGFGTVASDNQVGRKGKNESVQIEELSMHGLKRRTLLNLDDLPSARTASPESEASSPNKRARNEDHGSSPVSAAGSTSTSASRRRGERERRRLNSPRVREQRERSRRRLRSQEVEAQAS